MGQIDSIESLFQYLLKLDSICCGGAEVMEPRNGVLQIVDRGRM